MNRITMKQMTRATTQQYTKRTTEHMHLIKYRVKELFLSADVMPMPDKSYDSHNFQIFNLSISKKIVLLI